MSDEMLIAEKRGDYDRSHSKDAFIVICDGVRSGVFLDEAKTHVSVVVDTPTGGALCYSVAYTQFVAALRGGLVVIEQPATLPTSQA